MVKDYVNQKLDCFVGQKLRLVERDMYSERNMAYVYLNIAKLIEQYTPEIETDPFEHLNTLEGVKVDLDYDPKKE